MFFSRNSLATVAGFSATLVSLLVLPSPATANETAKVIQYWDYPAGGNATHPGFYSTEQDLTITQTAPSRYWAHYWRNHGENTGGYMGLQDTPGGKKALFSIWNSTEATPGSTTVDCGAFTHENWGMSCMMDFEWAVGTTYHLRVAAVSSRPSGSILWMATVQATTGDMGQPVGAPYIIGQIWSHPLAGYIASSDSWIEDFDVEAGTCDEIDQTPAQATFSIPMLNGGSATPTYGYQGSEFSCPNHSSQIIEVDGSVVLVE